MELRLFKRGCVGIEAGILLTHQLIDSLCTEVPGLLLKPLRPNYSTWLYSPLPPSAFLMQPNTGKSHGEGSSCMRDDPSFSSAWCRISWTVWDHMGILQYYNTPCEYANPFSWQQYHNLGGFQNSNVCWMIMSRSFNAEVLKVCTYMLHHTGTVVPAAA